MLYIHDKNVGSKLKRKCKVRHNGFTKKTNYKSISHSCSTWRESLEKGHNFHFFSLSFIENDKQFRILSFRSGNLQKRCEEKKATSVYIFQFYILYIIYLNAQLNKNLNSS